MIWYFLGWENNRIDFVADWIERFWQFCGNRKSDSSLMMWWMTSKGFLDDCWEKRLLRTEMRGRRWSFEGRIEPRSARSFALFLITQHNEFDEFWVLLHLLVVLLLNLREKRVSCCKRSSYRGGSGENGFSGGFRWYLQTFTPDKAM
jgi:hypothetical protein